MEHHFFSESECNCHSSLHCETLHSNTSHNTTSSMYMNAMSYDFEQQKVQRFDFIWQDFHSNEFFLSQQEKNNDVSQQGKETVSVT